MGVQRNGARSFLDLMRKACRLSHTPGFQTGLVQILGQDGIEVWTLWEALCTTIEALIAADNFFNRLDSEDEAGDTEDVGGDGPA